MKPRFPMNNNLSRATKISTRKSWQPNKSLIQQLSIQRPQRKQAAQILLHLYLQHTCKVPQSSPFNWAEIHLKCPFKLYFSISSYIFKSCLSLLSLDSFLQSRATTTVYQFPEPLVLSIPLDQPCHVREYDWLVPVLEDTPG